MRSFNKAAKNYDGFSDVQKEVGKQLILCLPKNQFGTLIDLGCGTGFTTQNLASSIEYQHFEAIDFSSSMIEQAKIYCSEKIYFKKNNFDLLPTNTYDLVFSNMALHWSEDLSTTLETIYLALKLNGLFAFSIPTTGTFEELAPYFNKHNFYNTAAIIEKLNSIGFSVIHNQNLTEYLHFDNLLQGLRMLKMTGATVCEHHDFSYSAIRKAIRDNYTQTLTYNIGLFILEKR